MTTTGEALAQRGPNPLRGEVGLELAGETLVLRPSFEALVAAEAEMGSLFRLVDRAAGGDVRLADVATLFWHCAVRPPDGGDRRTFEARLLAVGLARLLPAYRALLLGIFGGGR